MSTLNVTTVIPSEGTNTDLSLDGKGSGKVKVEDALGVEGHAAVGNSGTVDATRALTVVGASDGSGSSILVGYNSSLASKFSVRDDGLTTIGDSLVFNTAAKGVYLGTTSATAANLLDDYEEGTWTPAVTSSGGSITTVGGVSAMYTKVGRVVTIKWNITITTNGTGSGQVNVGSVPFAASGTWVGAGRENALTGKMQQCTLTGTSIGIKNYDDSYPGANGMNVFGAITYNTT